jgi:hypothetical protein
MSPKGLEKRIRVKKDKNRKKMIKFW